MITVVENRMIDEYNIPFHGLGDEKMELPNLPLFFLCKAVPTPQLMSEVYCQQ